MAAWRLEEMFRACRDDDNKEEEEELTEEQLRCNGQIQEDEMLALEAIYGENVAFFNGKCGLRSFQIQVHCEIPDDIGVSVKLSAIEASILGVGTDDGYEADGRFLHTFRVEHLPPILLTCLLPPSYSSHHPPYFTVSVQWLDTAKISSLCCILDSIWAEQQGQEVVYQWVQWLRSSALSHVGFGGGVVLGQSDVSCRGDARVVGELASMESIVQSMMSYNDEQCHESFLNGRHDCMICFNEHAGTDFIKLPCLHYFCRGCMETYSRMHVKEGTVFKLLCPDAKCGGLVPPNLLKRLLGDADFERWERLLLQKTLDSMADVVYCPRCETACLADEENHAQCSKCLFSFCTSCRERRHVGERCITPEEKLLSLQDRRTAHDVSKGDLRKRQDVAIEILSIREVLRDAVQCPSCKIAISRTAGCNHMRCSNCHQTFCYGCGQRLGGSHTSEQCLRAQQEKAVKQNEVIADFKKQVTRNVYGLCPGCPNCRQTNPKIGNNNHIFCWACQIHYCALCRKVVRKCSEHYGPRGCKQHTADPDGEPRNNTNHVG